MQVLQEGVVLFGVGVFEGRLVGGVGGVFEGGPSGVQEVFGVGGAVRGGGDFGLLGLGPGGEGDVEGFLARGLLGAGL